MSIKKRPAPKSRSIANASLDFLGQGDVTGDKINMESYRAAAERSTVYRRSAPKPQAKTAIAKPKRKESNEPLGATYGNRACLGWKFDKDRYAVQTRSYKMAKQLRRMRDAVLFADALDGPYMQTWLLPVRKEGEGRRMVDALLKSIAGECDQLRRVQSDREEVSGLPEIVSVENSDYSPAVSPQRAARDTAKKREVAAQDWSWVESRLDAVGVEFCVAFPRSDGEWAVQVTDTRLFRHFGKRSNTRVAGHSAGGWGTLRQFVLACDSKAGAREIVLTALSTLPEFGEQKHLLERVSQ